MPEASFEDTFLIEQSRVAELATEFLEATHSADRDRLLVEDAFERTHQAIEEVTRPESSVRERKYGLLLRDLDDLARSLAIVGSEVLSFKTADSGMREVQRTAYLAVESLREEVNRMLHEDANETTRVDPSRPDLFRTAGNELEAFLGLATAASK